MAHVRNGGAFHLAAFGAEGFCDALLFGIAAYETVARCDAAPMRRHANFGCSVDDGAAELFIHGEGERVGARRLAHGVTQVAYVHDVVHGIGRHNHIADFNGCVERAGDAGVEHCSHAETVYEDVAFGPRNMGLSEDEVDARIREALADVHLDFDTLSKRSPFELSGGQQRRVAFAGVLAMRPTTLVLDEPVAGLDPASRTDFLDLIKQLHEQRDLTVVMVSHNMNDIALLADRMLVMHEGEVAFLGTPEEIFTKHAVELREIGLGIPHAQTLANQLRAEGMPLPEKLYLPESLADEIARVLGGSEAVQS